MRSLQVTAPEVVIVNEESGRVLHEVPVMDTHILSYFSVFYMDLFDEVFVFESLSLIMIRWSVTYCHHVHSQSHEVSCDVM